MRACIISILSAMAIGLGYLLCNSEILMLAEYTNPVAMSPETLADLMQQPMGALQWAGCWLTQFFHIPALGALMVSAIWAAAAGLLSRCWRLDSASAVMAAVPSIALLWSIGSLGYWMHYSNITGFFFSHSIAILIIAIVLNISSKPNIIAMMLPAILYPVLGFWSAALAAALSAKHLRESKAISLAALASAAIAPAIWYAALYCKTLELSQIYLAGLPVLENSGATGMASIYPIFGCALFLAAAPFIGRTAYKYAPMGIAAASLAGALASSTHSEFFYKEILMQKAAMEGCWQQIISIGESSAQHTESMKVFYEMAMAQEGTLGSRAFASTHAEAQCAEAKAIKVNAMHIAAPIIHYYFGRYNISTRWCVEVGVKYGFGTGLLRMLAMSAQASGEKAAALKYREIIRKSLFFSHWEIPEPSQATKDFATGLVDRLETDHHCYEYLKYITTLKCDIHTPAAAEFAMYLAMRDRNKSAFSSIALSDSLMRKPLQPHFQEACAMMLDTIPPGMVSPQVASSFRDFSSRIQELRDSQDKSLIEPIRNLYGHTYWWYVYFEK